MCTNPLRGWKSNSNHVVKVTKSNVVAVRYDEIECKYHSIYKKDEITADCITEYIDIPCRSCLDCYNQSRREWIARSVAEAQCHDKMLFVTLTYDDEKIPKVEHVDRDTGEVLFHHTLRYRDFQLFMKKFRKEFDIPIRFMCCGEYGSRTFRPHYHAIFYGIGLSDIPDAVPHSRSKTGDFLYSSEYLDKLWKKGYTLVADANTATIAYVAGYVAKKADTVEAKSFYDYFNIARPFIRASLRPALGSEWFRAHIDDFSSRYDYHSVPTSDEPVKIYLTSNWKSKYDAKVFNDVYDALGLQGAFKFNDGSVDRRALLLDDYFLHLDTDMSREDFNHTLQDILRDSSKRKRGVY